MKGIYSNILIFCITLFLTVLSIGCNGSTDVPSFDESSMRLAESLGAHDLYGIGGVARIGYEPTHNDLATIIFDTKTQLDADHGEKLAYMKNESNREQFYIILRDTIENSLKFDVKPYYKRNFAGNFIEEFGSLPDADFDKIPDIISDDDDCDNILDSVDDDDDNDGCMDWDEKDGNLGGLGSSYTETEDSNGAIGLGRGDGPGKPGEPVETGADDPTNPANGGDTSKYDDGE